MFDLKGYEASLLEGAWVTLEVALASLLLALLLFFGGQVFINAVCSWVNETYNNWLLESNPAQEWVSLLPDYVDISPFAAGVATIGFIFGAYMTETFRGAILAVDKGELEAARAFGMRATQVFRRILFPQMMRHALPGFGNNWLVLLKTTALVSIIGLDDMVRKASLAAGSTQQPFTFYMAVALIFLIFTAVSTSALKWAERHYAIKTR